MYQGAIKCTLVAFSYFCHAYFITTYNCLFHDFLKTALVEAYSVDTLLSITQLLKFDIVISNDIKCCMFIKKGYCYCSQ